MNRFFLQPDEQSTELPKELKIHIMTYLDDPTLKSLSIASTQFYHFIHEFYLKTTGFGKLISLSRYYDEQLKELEKNINTYKASQQSAVTNLKSADNLQRLELVPSILRICLLSFVIYRIYDLFTVNRPRSFALDYWPLIRSSVWVVCGLGVLYLRLQILNKNLLVVPLTDNDKQEFNKLVQNNSALTLFTNTLQTTQLALINNNPVTQQGVNTLLDAIVENSKTILATLDNILINLRGDNKAAEKLDLLTIEDSEIQLVLEKMIEHWNIAQGEQQENRITYACGK